MKIEAQKRETFGKQNKNLRRERKIPAVVFGKEMESTPIVIDRIDFTDTYREAGETSLIDIDMEGKKNKVIIKEVQFDPVTLKPIHASFYKVDLKKKIRANVPVLITGEEENELIKKGEGLALTLLNEIEVEALPANLPSNFTVDVSDLEEIGDGVTAAELEYNKDEVELIDVSDEKLIVKMDWAEMEEIEEEEELTEEELIEQIEITEEMEAEMTEEELEEKKKELAKKAAEGEGAEGEAEGTEGEAGEDAGQQEGGQDQGGYQPPNPDQ